MPRRQDDATDHHVWQSHCRRWRYDLIRWLSESEAAVEALENLQQRLQDHQRRLTTLLADVDKCEALLDWHERLLAAQDQGRETNLDTAFAQGIHDEQAIRQMHLAERHAYSQEQHGALSAALAAIKDA